MNKPILIIGGVSIDTIIQLDALPEPVPQTIWPNESYSSLGSTGTGKALNPADYRGFMERMINEGKELVVCTHGADGATLLNRGGRCFLQWLSQWLP